MTESDGEKQSNLSTFEGKQPNLSISDFPTMVTWNVYQAIKLNRKAKYSWLVDNIGVSERTITHEYGKSERRAQVKRNKNMNKNVTPYV